MSAAVPFSEALDILHRMIREPGQVRAIRGFDEASFGPLPVFFGDTEVTVDIEGGVVTGLVSIRVDRRYSNRDDWIRDSGGDPWDELAGDEADRLELAISGVAYDQSGRIGSG